MAEAAVLMAVFGTLYVFLKKKDKPKALFFKAAATATPTFLLLRHTVEQPSGAALWTLAGLIFYMAADVLLECRFVRGAACFSAGHICVAAGFLLSARGILETGAYMERTVPEGISFAAVILVVFAAAAYTVLHPYFPHLKKKRLLVPAVLYILILSLMASLAVAYGLLQGGREGSAAVLGAVCFVASDILLGKNRLGRKRSAVRGMLVLILYYLSVYLLAMRIWV